MLSAIGLTLALLDFSGLSRFLERALSEILRRGRDEFREAGIVSFLVHLPFKKFLTKMNDDGNWHWDLRPVARFFLSIYACSIAGLAFAYFRHLLFPDLPWKGGAGHLAFCLVLLPGIIGVGALCAFCIFAPFIHVLLVLLYWIFYLLALPPSRTTGSIGLLLALLDFANIA